MKESLLCKVLVFLADTPKSAGSRNPIAKIFQYCLVITVQNLSLQGSTCRKLDGLRGLTMSLPSSCNYL